ncbi:MAG: acetyl-CoA carboxylase biotin carboxyl carrier protein [Holophagales bacterium]|nr:acetyl-CoA carboxylase biotin carboxyl carrier protein [Holophagales bacterium]MXX60173.1 acetyl-CoA carboxylase biotin carboxyl carrier protein [Holophagales bacterium]MYC11482.1 acetyl-CoA carboxylase biotin carboxyl carrier protein [Holophagales bacterium]MYD20759.1 acetyl-CoA carboxylase biotin carboxyl carrier protein [Holophagales bacterium]MYI33652.1 acetyl-CoA carboxylase biotin carboxyl carrier protein [Holophagales bacterium]
MLSNEEIQALIRFVAEERRGGSDLSVEYQVDGLYVRVGGDRGGGAGAPRPAPAAAAATQATTPPSALEDVPAAEEPALDGHVLTSPIVGTFYAAPSPDSPPYVEIGGRVEKGQVVCIVEAMKLMNEIEADVSGTVSSVVPDNGDPVEFGAPLFVIQT